MAQQWEENLEEGKKEMRQDYRDLVNSQGWNRFRVRLERLLTQKEAVKAAAIRKLEERPDAIYAVTLLQGYIDALNFVISEPHRTITRLTNQGGDQ